jgi:hypothetical protein
MLEGIFAMLTSVIARVSAGGKSAGTTICKSGPQHRGSLACRRRAIGVRFPGSSKACEKSVRRTLIAPMGGRDIEHVSVLVDSAPEIPGRNLRSVGGGLARRHHRRGAIGTQGVADSSCVSQPVRVIFLLDLFGSMLCTASTRRCPPAPPHAGVLRSPRRS